MCLCLEHAVIRFAVCHFIPWVSVCISVRGLVGGVIGYWRFLRWHRIPGLLVFVIFLNCLFRFGVVGVLLAFGYGL